MTNLRTDTPSERIPMYVAGAVAAVAAVLGLICAIAGVNAGVVVFLLLIAVIGGAVGLRFWLRERRAEQDRAAEEQRWTAEIEAARQRAGVIEREQRELVQRRAGQLDQVRITLSSLAD